MFEVDPSSIGALGAEVDFDLARPFRIRLDLRQTRCPTEHDAPRRLVDKDTGPTALAAVGRAVIDVPSGSGLEDHLGQLALEDVVFAGATRTRCRR